MNLDGDREKLAAEAKLLLEFGGLRPRWEVITKAAGNCLYERIVAATQFLDREYGQNAVRFGARLACVANQVWDIPVCKRAGCGAKLDLRGLKPSQAFPKHCSCKCSGADADTDYKRKATKTEKYGSAGYNNREKAAQTIAADPGFWSKRNAKTRATKLALHGSETYVNLAAMKQTKLERHGDPNYSNRVKFKQTMDQKPAGEKAAIAKKRRATLEAKLAADPGLAAEIQRKSVATRKERHGEDYTGRAKSAQTCLERYGVANPWQAESVKEAIRQKCLAEHGVENYPATPECRAKIAATCQQRYGSPSYLGSEAGRESIAQSNLAKFGVEHSWQRNDVKQQIRETNLEKYGCAAYICSEQGREAVRRTNLAKYGYEWPWQSNEVKQRIRETNRKRYGVDFPAQNPELRRKWQKRYEFSGIKFDSAPELAFYLWLRDCGISFEYQPDIAFEYETAGRTRRYQPDFRVGEDMLFEIKGDQFFVDGKMVNPYDRSQDEIYEAKRKCMLEHSVVVLQSGHYAMFELYVARRYGEAYIQSFRRGSSAANLQ